VKAPVATALTAFAIALLAFYAGVALEAGRTTLQIEFPDTAPPITTIGRGGGSHDVWVTETVATAQSHTDWLQTLATAGALVGAAFLLARLAIMVVRQIHVRRAA
jgi:hypothetical protein